ncbi:MAG: glutamate mutase L [Oscillospiraceae bacterium]|jgi:uncharacterized protein (TIGR01319 family)|nr:glutamate mutase L [Oscillospiraceae bacterium]
MEKLLRKYPQEAPRGGGDEGIRYRIFIDFGSTFTKAVAFDMKNETLAGRAQAPSTVLTDVATGLRAALSALSEQIHITEEEVRGAIACSSAAGGLRMAVVGLVPDYTTKAAHLAALGAGAKVVGSFSHELSRWELRELEELDPDIVLLTGGTDGGNRKTIVHNAQMLAKSDIFAIIVAGNKSANDEIMEVFAETSKFVTYSPNVMPEFGFLDIEPVNQHIRELFISRIIHARGMEKVSEIIAGVVCPTPSAVLQAAQLIANGTDDEPGLGELLLVDVGGATTDVCSIAVGTPTREGARMLGLREPTVKRTVEGDLGLYHNLDTLAAELETELNPQERDALETALPELRDRLSIPDGQTLTRHQIALARAAVRTAVTRHVGRLEPVVTITGEAWVQRGKDLSNVRTVIGAGGPLAFSGDARRVLTAALATPDEPLVLAPQRAELLLDERYILFAVGLLARKEPSAALRIAKRYLQEI